MRSEQYLLVLNCLLLFDLFALSKLNVDMITFRFQGQISMLVISMLASTAGVYLLSQI